MTGQMGMHAGQLTGSFRGHLLPGVLFLVWAGWWTLQLVASRGAAADRTGTLEAGWVAPWGKLLLPLVGVVGELAPDGFVWAPETVNNYQHAVMYLGFSLAGAVDLLARAGRLRPGATHLAHAGACLNAGLLFAGHGHMGGLADTVHALLVVLFVANAGVALAERGWPGRGVGWLRTGAMYLLGLWLVEIAWILYRSGWPLADHTSQMKAYLSFSLTVGAVTVALLALHQLLGAPGSGTALLVDDEAAEVAAEADPDAP